MSEAPERVASSTSISAYYLCLFVAIGAYGPFMAVDFAARGVSPVRLADALAISPVVRVLVGPLWAAAADRMRSATWALRASTSLAAAAFLGVVIAPSASTLVLAMVVYAALRAPVGALIDTVNLHRAQHAGGSFGALRMWGTVGYMLAVLLTGALVSRGRIEAVRWVSLAGIALAAASTYRMPVVLGRERVALRPALRALARRPRFVAILAAGMLHQVGLAAYDGLFALHLTRLGGGAAASYAIALGTACEVAVMFHAQRVIARLGVDRALLLSFLVGAARWLVVAASRSVPVLVLAQSAHAISFGLYFVAAVARIDREAPVEVRASAQGIQMAAVWGVASALSLRLAGALGGADAIGRVFSAGALGSLAAAAIVAAAGRANPPGGPRGGLIAPAGP